MAGAASREEPEFDYEDPSLSWLELVKACHEPDHVERRQRVESMLALARNSHWTFELWQGIEEGFYDYSSDDSGTHPYCTQDEALDVDGKEMDME
jgi:hypothetical protein